MCFRRNFTVTLETGVLFSTHKFRYNINFQIESLEMNRKYCGFGAALEIEVRL
jgi:hypothetical protein